MLFLVLPKPEVVLTAKLWQIEQYIILKLNSKSDTTSSFMWFPPYFYFRFGRRRYSGVVYRPFGATLQVAVRPMLRDHSPLCPVCSVCNVGVLWPNGWMDQDDTWCGGRPRLMRHCVRWKPSSPHGKGHSSPHFSGLGYCGQTVAHLSNWWALV